MPHRNVWANNGGVYFGLACSNTEGPPENIADSPIQYVGDRHIITFGPNGSGKSRRLLLPNLVNLTHWSMLVIDPKGELAAMTGEHRKKLTGAEVVYLNPFKVLGMRSDGFNPVAALDPASPDFIDDAQGLAEALIRVEGREPHWSASAQELLCALIMYSRLTHKAGGSLGHVRELLGQPAKEFVEDVHEIREAGVKLGCEEMTIKIARFADLTQESRELQSIISTAMTQTRWLDSRLVREDVGHGSFDFSLMKERPVTIYLMLPANRLGTHANWLRLMITAVVQKLMKDVRRAEVPVLLMLDEFAHLGELPIITNTMAMMRGYGVKLWAVYQDLPQAQLMGHHESFVANAGVVQAFAPQDMTTARYLSDRTGQTTGNVMTYSSTVDRHTGRPNSENVNVTPTSLPTMLPQDIINMDEGYSILFSHKTKGTIRAYMPEPSVMRGFENIVNRAPN